MVTFRGVDGKTRRRSTKVPADGGMYNGEHLSKAQAKKRALMIGLQIAGAVNDEFTEHDNKSIRDACEEALATMNGRVLSVQTKQNAQMSLRCFLRFLGERASTPLRLFKRSDAIAFVDWRRSQVRCRTVKKDLTAISSVFLHAVDSEIIAKNPFANIHVAPDTKEEKVVHEAFTADELRLLVAKLPGEWSSAVRCSFELYGQRLGDVLSLRWSQFDWSSGVVRLITGKTGRVMVQPMRPAFAAWAAARMAEIGGEYVHPTLAHHTNPSAEFTQLVRLHGIGLIGKASGGNRRTWHSKTFHSIRASVATMLQAGGVAQGLTMELVGHESAAVHAAYIRPNLDQLRGAIEVLPEL